MDNIEFEKLLGFCCWWSSRIQFLRCWRAVNQAYYDCLEEQQGN